MFSDINWWSLGAQFKDKPAFGWYVITFAIFVYFLLRFLKPPVKQHLQERSDSFARELNAALEAKDKAEKRLLEQEEHLRRLTSELQTIQANMKAQIAMEREQTISSTNSLIEQLKRDAQESLEAQGRNVIKKIKQEVVSSMIEQIAKSLPAKISEQDHVVMEQSCISKLDALPYATKGLL